MAVSCQSATAASLDELSSLDAAERGVQATAGGAEMPKDTFLLDTFSVGTKISPTDDELKNMTVEEVDHWCENFLAEQKKQLHSLNVDNIKRDPLATADASITFKDVSFSILVPDTEDPKHKKKVEKVILDDCCGHFEAGSLVALMGPSGCGKSTLLDILAKKKTSAYSGSVYLNGCAVDQLYQRIVSYVGQEDIMPAHWTVKEAVAFNAFIKKPSPANVSQKINDKFLDSLLEDLGLLHVKDTKIGGSSVRGISGGQRRRVSLARGIANGSAVLYLDEPTSGLSATDAELCVKTMRLMAKKFGITIIVVIHQPRVEVAELFDHLLLLTSKPGRVVYNGPMADAAAHWAKVGYPVPAKANPTDHFLDTVTPGAPDANPDAFVAYYNKHQLPTVKAAVEKALNHQGPSIMDMLEAEHEIMSKFGKVPKLTKTVYGTGFFTQLRLVFGRKVTLMMRNTETLAMSIGMQIFMGVFMGLCYFDVASKGPQGPTQMSFLFMLLMQVAMSSMQIMPALIDERTVMKLEVSEKLYSEWAHIAAAGILNTLNAVVGNTLFIVIMYAMGGMDFAHFFSFYFWATLLFIAMDALVCFVAAAAKDAQTAQAQAMPFLMIFIMFSGFLVSKNSAPSFLKWMLYVSPVSWVMEAIAQGLYGDDQTAWALMENMFGLEKPSEVACIAICLGVACFFRVAEMLSLKFLNNIQK